MEEHGPFTMQLSEASKQWIEVEMKRTGCSREEIMETLVEESIRQRRFLGIGFTGPEDSRRAWVVGAGLDVWEIIEDYKDLGSVQRMLEFGDLTEVSIRRALEYYHAYPEEIDEAVAENARSPEEWYASYPGIVPDPSGG